MILKYGEVPYEEDVITFPQWGGGIKASGEKAVFGQLPSITVVASKKLVSQSGAIIRYCGKLAGVVPEQDDLVLDADMMVELANDMNAINPILNFYPKDSEAYNDKKTVFFNSLPAWLSSAQKVLNNKPFYGGEKPSYGDFAFFAVCDNISFVKDCSFDEFVSIKEWIQRIRELPQIATYLAERPGPHTPDWGMPGSHIMSV